MYIDVVYFLKSWGEGVFFRYFCFLYVGVRSSLNVMYIVSRSQVLYIYSKWLAILFSLIVSSFLPLSYTYSRVFLVRVHRLSSPSHVFKWSLLPLLQFVIYGEVWVVSSFWWDTFLWFPTTPTPTLSLRRTACRPSFSDKVVVPVVGPPGSLSLLDPYGTRSLGWM